MYKDSELHENRVPDEDFGKKNIELDDKIKMPEKATKDKKLPPIWKDEKTFRRFANKLLDYDRFCAF